MKLVYIAGPFRAKSEHVPGHQDMFAVQENIMAAMRLGLDMMRGTDFQAFPVIPHANTMFFTASAPDQVWLDGDMEMLRVCAGILMTTDWQRSSGARAEHEFAQKHAIPIFYDVPSVKNWLDQQAAGTLEVQPTTTCAGHK